MFKTFIAAGTALAITAGVAAPASAAPFHLSTATPIEAGQVLTVGGPKFKAPMKPMFPGKPGGFKPVPPKPWPPKPPHHKPHHNHGAAAAIGIGAFALGTMLGAAANNQRRCYLVERERYDPRRNAIVIRQEKICQ